MDERDYYQLFYCGKVHYINYKTGEELSKTEMMKLETYVLDYKDSTKQSMWRKMTVILKNVTLYYEGSADRTTIIAVDGVQYELKVPYMEFEKMYNMAESKSAFPILN